MASLAAKMPLGFRTRWASEDAFFLWQKASTDSAIMAWKVLAGKGSFWASAWMVVILWLMFCFVILFLVCSRSFELMSRAVTLAWYFLARRQVV